MRFKHPDTCWDDYERRRNAFMKYIIVAEPDVKKRCERINDWLDLNSPLEPHEKLANLMRALTDY